MSRLWKFEGDGRQLGVRGSWVGAIGTLGLLALCLSIYIPAVLKYLSGDHHQSLYESTSSSGQTFYTRKHFKMALTIRNKATGAVLNHSQLLDSSLAFVTYKNHSTIYQQPLLPCNSNYFVKDVDGLVLQDCLMIPDYVQYDSGFDQGNFAEIYFTIQAPIGSSPFPSSTTQLSQAQYLYASLLKDYYCEFYFTSQVLDTDSSIKLKVHRAYSTQLSFGSETIGANFDILSGIRVTLMDDSIMPWKNNRNVTTMNWNGDFAGKAALTFNQVGMSGFKDSFKIVDKVQYAVRFYKKLDWLLGIIGGGCFLFYLIFRFIFSYYNRYMAIIDLANSILLIKTTEEFPETVQDLIQPKISSFYPIRRLVPFCSIERIEKLIKQSEQMNDIFLQIKRQKVTLRNLQTLKILGKFQQKQVRFLQLEKLEQQQDSSKASQSTYKKQIERRDDIQFDFRGKQNSHEVMDESINSDSVQNANKFDAIQIAAAENIVVINAEQDGQNIAKFVPPGQAVKIINHGQDGNREREEEGVISPEEVEISEKLGLTLPQVKRLLKVREMEKYFSNAHSYRIVRREYTKQQVQKQLTKIRKQLKKQNPIPIPDFGGTQRVERQQPIKQQQYYFEGLQGQQPIRQSQYPLQESQRQQPRKLTETTPVLNVQQQAQQQTLKQRQSHLMMRQVDNQKQHKFYQETQSYNKYESNFDKKVTCKSCVSDAVSSFLKKCDFFTAQVKIWDQGIQKSCCWIIPNLLIIILACLTFAIAIQNMNTTTFTSDQKFLEVDKIKFARQTDQDFNAVICIPDPTYYVGVGTSAKFNFIIQNNGQTQAVDPVRMTASDPTLNLANNLRFTQSTLKQTNCFRLPFGQNIEMTQNSHFGIQFQPQCTNTPSFCDSNTAQTYNNFVQAFNLNPFLLILPASRFDPFTQKLATDVFTFTYINAGQIKFQPNINLQETVFVSQVRLYDDSGNTFMEDTAPMVQSNINLGYDTRRTVMKAVISAIPSYTLRIRLNQAATDYIIRQYKINWIFGIIGGAIFFWYMIIRFLTNPLLNFNTKSRLAKAIYGEASFQSSWFKKILAMIYIPRWLIPTCCDLRFDVVRMRAVNSKIQRTINHINLLKYITNCFKLSSRFFSSQQTDDFAQIFFRQKIFQDEKIEKNNRIGAFGGDSTFKDQDNLVSMESDPSDDEEENDNKKKSKKKKNNKVANSTNVDKEFEENQGQSMINDQIKPRMQQQQHKNQQAEQKGQESDGDFQFQHENIIDREGQQKIRDKIDLFAQTRQFSLNGKRQYSSVTGGICSVLMIVIVLVVAWFMIGKYLKNDDLTVSYDVKLEDAPNSDGLEFVSGDNFKFGISFINSGTLQPYDPSPLLPDVGFSVLIQNYSRSNGVITPSLSKIDLEPCSSTYLTSWVSPLVEQSYLNSMMYLYCVPKGYKLRIWGTAESSLRQTFKLSIYNRQGGAQGLTKIGNLLNTTYVKVYVSSPTQNSFDQIPKYEINEILYSKFGGRSPVVPYESNITLSKVRINFTDQRQWQKQQKQIQTYRIEPFNTDMIGYQYLGINPNLNIWFNVSFAYTYKVHLYTHDRPKFAEVFGIIGGICALLYLVLGCFAGSFTSYKLRYQIGKQVYLFGKRLIIKNSKNIKTKLRKQKKDKKLLQTINNMNQFHILSAYLLTPFAYIANQYNFNENLRRVTLIQDRVERDLDLQNFYKELYRSRDSLRKKLKQNSSKEIPLTDYFFKQIANHSPNDYSITSIRNYAKRHNITSYEQRLVQIAGGRRVNVREVLTDQLLEELFDKVVEQNMRIEVNQVRDTEGSIGTSSMGSSYGDGTVPQTDNQ